MPFLTMAVGVGRDRNWGSSTLHSQGFHASRHIGHALVPIEFEESSHLAAAIPGATDTENGTIPGDLVDTTHDLAHRDQHGVGQRTLCPLGSLAHVEKDALGLLDPSCPLARGHALDLDHGRDRKPSPRIRRIRGPPTLPRRRLRRPVIDIAVLASGSGTNLQALIDSDRTRPHIRLVVSDNPAARALERAEEAGITTAVTRWEGDRSIFSSRLADVVEDGGAKGVVLAGFMRILAPSFVDRFPNRILNIHPSLLPAFPGARAVEAALERGVKVTGVTVHFVDEEVDHGPIIAQEPVRVLEGDTVQSLHHRIQEVEHVLYPETVGAFIEGSISVDRGRVIRR